ncbi:phage portal protein [Variovorax sp. RT4R15]|uniref:phage portal protein n=1 Tax=Variovorax sp. RT4R15 TaxID=3443737 RepID=UPI003F4721B6
MNPFYALGNWVMGGLRRVFGLQFASPGSYAQEAAAEVTWDSAMQLSGVWACVKLLAETVASLPLTLYKTTENGRKVAESHALSIIFSGKPNRYQTKVEFFETVMLNLVMHGNAYCRITRAGDRITSLLPLMSAQMEVTLLQGGAVVYQYTNGADVSVYAAESIWHLKLMGNGIIGMSPLAYQRNTLGIAQAAEGAVTKIYRNGAKPSGVLTVDRILTPNQRAEIKSNFSTLSEGTDDRMLTLEAGMKFQAVSLTPQDIELLASRKWQLAEICRWYGVPSVMVNDNSGSTVWGSGISEIVAGFYKVTLRPICEKIEASILCNLLTPAERLRYSAEFDFDALLRADQKSRYESYRIGIAGGFLTPDEARESESRASMPGGGKLYIQGAMVPIELAGTKQPAPAPQGNNDGIQDPQTD